MRWLIKRCVECWEYTLKDICPRCGSETKSPHPAKFSPYDKYVKYKAYEGNKAEEYMSGQKES